MLAIWLSLIALAALVLSLVALGWMFRKERLKRLSMKGSLTRVFRWELEVETQARK